MYKYTNMYINCVSLLISIIIFCSFNFIISNINNFNKNTHFKAGFETEEKNLKEEENIKETEENKTLNENIQSTEIDKIEKTKNKEEWYLEIPKINLKANIEEGTTKDIMDNYIGHFEETNKLDGNIGLAAHNRGYKNNYFENLKKLQNGDVLIYNYKNNMKTYKVIDSSIILDTDWKKLENTKENKLTLITCVENEPTYRRCIQAIEVN